jgi:ATP-dependent helicase HrpA
MFFRVLDEKGKPIASGRDLAKIRRELGAKVEDSFSKIGGETLHKDAMRDWDFGDLPERLDLRRGGMTVIVYPALLDQGNAVGTRVVETLERAKEMTHAGVRRLFLIKAGREIRHRVATRSGVERMCAQYATLGSANDLLADVHALVAERAFMTGRPNVRTKAQFDARFEEGWNSIAAGVDEITKEAELIVAEYQKVRLVLDPQYPAPFTHALTDMKDQLSFLVFKGFLATIPTEWRKHLPRYLAGIRVRIGKLAPNLARDTKLMAETQPYWRAAKARVELHAKAGVTDPALTTYRWMVEEYRIAQFAQELRTAITVSPKRLQEQWDTIGKP